MKLAMISFSRHGNAKKCFFKLFESSGLLILFLLFLAVKVFFPISELNIWPLIDNGGGKFNPYFLLYFSSVSSLNELKSNGCGLGLSWGPFEFICFNKNSCWAACAAAFLALFEALELLGCFDSDSEADSLWFLSAMVYYGTID